MFQSFNHFAPFKSFEIGVAFKDSGSKIRSTFARDRRRYLDWVFEAKKRFRLVGLDYVVTSNHVHLLVKDTGPNVIAESMQLIAGRTAQE